MKKLLILPLFLAACATATGPQFNEAALPGGTSVIVYRPSEFGIPRGAKLSINGAEKCTIPASSFAVFETAEGLNNVAANVFDMGTSSLPIDAHGQHFIRISWNRGASSGAVFGAIGAAVSAGVSGGPFNMVEVTKAQALSEMGNLKQGC